MLTTLLFIKPKINEQLKKLEIYIHRMIADYCSWFGYGT